MLTREQVRSTIDKLPENFTIDQLIDHLIFIDKVEEGLKLIPTHGDGKWKSMLMIKMAFL